MSKIDAETEVKKVNTINPEASMAIQKARQRLGLTQKDLAFRINEKVQLVNEYESGKATNPNQAILAKMEKVLEIKLRGTGIGNPL